MCPLRPTNAIAADALLPGDPHRALWLATDLLVEPKMSNHAHGLWGYGGRTTEGHELTIQSLGIGGPSGAMVLAELARHGVRRAVQLGTCRALDPEFRLGDLLCVRQAVGGDGVSRALGAEPSLGPDPKLGRALRAAAEAEGIEAATVASADVLGELDGRPPADWAQRGAVAVEMSCAALFAAGPRCGVEVAAMMAVSDAGGEAIDDEPLQRASERMGRIALAALFSSG